MKQNKWRKFVSYYRPYKKVFAADMFFACLGATISLVIPLLIRYITTVVIYNDHKEAVRMILMLGAFMLVLIGIEAYSNFFITCKGHIMGAKMEYDMRNEIFTHYQKLSFRFFDNQKVGQLMSRVTNDLFEISELFHHGPEDIVISIIKIVGSFSILCIVNWKLALIAFAIVPIMIVYAAIFNVRMKRAFKRNRVKIAEVNGQIEDSLSGIRVVKSFANEDMEIQNFEKGNHRFLETKKDSYRYMGMYHSGLGALVTMITVFVIISGGLFITGNVIEIADLITFLLYISNFTEPVKKLINFTEQFQNGVSGYERFLEILEIEPDIMDAKNAKELRNVKGEIEFRDVSFSYEEGKEEILKNINLKVHAGEYIALVGMSGVGKSTLCSLIPRFYEVTGGAITIDGVDIRNITQVSLRKSIGMVQQDVYLFAGSVLENIRYGKMDATEEEVIEAAKNANAHDFICNLPDGYHTYIGQRGIKLSGGQKQRLSIARVFLKNPPILIFDEATSALDNESEKVVQYSLEKLAKNRTTFVIAHRLSTIRNAEKIIVLGEHGIEEEGNHKTLLEKNGIYANLYQK